MITDLTIDPVTGDGNGRITEWPEHRPVERAIKLSKAVRTESDQFGPYEVLSVLITPGGGPLAHRVDNRAKVGLVASRVDGDKRREVDAGQVTWLTPGAPSLRADAAAWNAVTGSWVSPTVSGVRWVETADAATLVGSSSLVEHGFVVAGGPWESKSFVGAQFDERLYGHAVGPGGLFFRSVLGLTTRLVLVRCCRGTDEGVRLQFNGGAWTDAARLAEGGVLVVEFSAPVRLHQVRLDCGGRARGQIVDVCAVPDAK
ncbi:MAG: hypothetical protein K2Q09_03540 [Phycisphaerales bacterium]|nr:hypothetical protein [Phycisphaerales bacterium]